MKISFRQGIVRYQTDASDNPVFLQYTGSGVSLIVSPDPTVITLSQGASEYLYTESVTITNAWTGPFSVGIKYWLYWDLDRTTGLRSFGHTIREPFTGPNPPPSPMLDQHWFDTTRRKMFVWQGQVWGERVRVFAAEMLNGAFVSVGANTPLFSGTQVGLAYPYNSGGIAFDDAGKPIRKSDATFFTTEDLFTAGVPSGSSLKINTIIVYATAVEPLAQNQIVMLQDYNEISHADPIYQTSRIFGILEEDAPTGESVRMVTEGRISSDQWDWEAAGADVNANLYADSTGAIVLVPVIGDQFPIGQVVDKTTILFRPYTAQVLNGVPITDHGELTGLADDDHPQYFNSTRGNTQYYPRTELDPVLDNKTDIGHLHTKSDITDFAHTHSIADVSGLQVNLDSKLNRAGDTMAAGANLTFQTAGEVLGLPAVPTDPTAAASKAYVDASIPTLPGAGTNITIGATIDVSPQGIGSGLDADTWDGQQSLIAGPVNGEVLTYQGGVWINAAAAGGGGSKIEDTDGDTYIDTEFLADSDTIIMVLGADPGGVDDGFISAKVVDLGRSSLDFTALNSTSAGADINLTAGNSSGAYVSAGDINIVAGTNTHAGDGYGGDVNITGGGADNNYGYTGDVNITGGSNTNTSGFTDGGNVNISGGAVSSTYGFPGPGGVNITAGTDDAVEFSGDVRIVNQTVTTKGGDVAIGASDAIAGVGGNVEMAAGDGDVGGGQVFIQGGNSQSSTNPITGDVQIAGGSVTNGLAGGGEVRILTGSSTGAGGGNGGKFHVDCGAGRSFGGDIHLEAGTGFSARGGYARMEGGNATNHNGGIVDLRGGNTSSDDTSHVGGIVTIEGGSSYFGYGRGGDIVLLSGEGPGPSQTQPGTHGAGNIELIVRGNTLADNGVVQIKSTSIDFLPVHNPELQLFSNSTTNHVKIQAPTGLAGNTQFTLPPDNGTVDYVLRTDGSGITSWVEVTGGGGGSSSRIEDADMDTFVDTEYDGNENEVHIHLGQDVGGRTAGPVAQFTQFDTIIRTLDSAINGHAGSIRLLAGECTYDGSRNGGSVNLEAGNSYEGDAGSIRLTAGDSTGTGSGDNGGSVVIAAGQGYDGTGGEVVISGGQSDNNTAGAVTITGGYGYYGAGGDVTVQTAYNFFGSEGSDTANIDIKTGYNSNFGYTGDSGSISLTTGYVSHGAYSGDSGGITIKTGDCYSNTTNTAGAINIIGGYTTGVGSIGGNIVITPGISNVGTNGTVVIDGTTMPQDTPAVGEVLQTDASGVSSWETIQYIEQFAANTSFTVTHSLGQQWCTVQVYNTATGVNIVPTTVTLNSTTQCTVVIGASTAVTVVVVGMANVPVN